MEQGYEHPRGGQHRHPQMQRGSEAQPWGLQGPQAQQSDPPPASSRAPGLQKLLELVPWRHRGLFPPGTGSRLRSCAGVRQVANLGQGPPTPVLLPVPPPPSREEPGVSLASSAPSQAACPEQGGPTGRSLNQTLAPGVHRKQRLGPWCQGRPVEGLPAPSGAPGDLWGGGGGQGAGPENRSGLLLRPPPGLAGLRQIHPPSPPSLPAGPREGSWALLSAPPLPCPSSTLRRTPCPHPWSCRGETHGGGSRARERGGTPSRGWLTLR